ncbi:PilZ domain-containing protein [Roseibium aquae]|uniref:PilZ domain-containing protein n=1 Tax=Roseibium aquae TaxID=1323746 RepID=UPI00123D7722|nr:PilZ domain-containing protein [Roseibium aquae]
MSDETDNPQDGSDDPQAENAYFDADLPRERRSRVLKKGKLIFDGGLRSVPVLVRNISNSGAKLQFEQAYLLPKVFTLHIELDDFEVECERRWENGLHCGVAFVGDKKYVGRERVQVLKPSDHELVEKIDADRVTLDGYYQRAHTPGQAAPREPTPPKSTRRVFGKRR